MKSHVNLLPYGVLSQQVLRCWLRRWFVIGCVAAVAATLAVGNVWHAATLAESQRERLEEDYQPVKEAKQQIKTLRARIGELQQREAISTALADERPPLAVIGLVSRAAQSCRGEVFVEQLEFKRDAAAPARRSAADNRPGGSGLLSLKGTGLSNVAVAQFAAALRDSGVFQRVELKSTIAEKKADGEFRNYNIECVF